MRNNLLLFVLSLALLLSGVASKGGRHKGHKHAKQVKKSSDSNLICNPKRKVLWFMAVQSTSKDRETSYYNHVLAAVNSAKAYAPALAPILIHGGSASELPVALQRLPDLKLVSHNLTFLPQLTEAWGNHPYLGAWYRFDIPFIVRNVLRDLKTDEYDLDYVLYTDTDVLFFNDFNGCTLPKPPVLYIGPEHERGTQANSGVLYMNVTAMEQHWPSVLKLAIEKKFNFVAVDQGLFLEYYVMGNHSTLLPDRFNWKGYWGGSDDMVITHFHGPKPGHCLSCLLLYRVNFESYCAQVCLADYISLMRITPDNGALYERMLHSFSNFTRHG